MKIQTIIAEYNPFHNGHLYQLHRSLELTHADYTVALMGGNFLQRGSAAMWDKYTRAKMCLLSGIDLAIELPFAYATGSAGDFAMGAVSLLNRLNCIDNLCFGAECPDLDLLMSIAQILCNESGEYSKYFKECIRQGCSYPLARSKALSHITGNDALNDIISKPNNTLAIEYLVALKKTKSSIKPVLIERTNDYHDQKLNNSISSATAIRKSITKSAADDSCNIPDKDIPDASYKLISSSYHISAPISTDMLTPFVQSALISSCYSTDICDMTEDICNKIYKISTSVSLDELISTIKSKNITESRIRRCILHMLMGYTNDDRKTFINEGYAFYANILGFKKESSILLRYLKNNTSIPFITKKADALSIFKGLSPEYEYAAKKMWSLDMRATALYNCLVKNAYGTDMPNDYTIQLPVV